jgi:hypothetical protein
MKYKVRVGFAPPPTASELLDRFNWLDAWELAARVEAVLALLDYADGAPVSTGIVATDAVRRVLNGVKP